jgi:hypothetical protein
MEHRRLLIANPRSDEHFEREQTSQTESEIQRMESVSFEDAATLAEGSELRDLRRMKTKLPAAEEMDQALYSTEYLLGYGVAAGPKQNEGRPGLEHAAELGKDPVNLGMRKVLHNAHVPQPVEAVTGKRQLKDISGKPHVHDGVATFQDGRDNVESDENPFAAELVQTHGSLRSTGTRFEEDSLRGKIAMAVITNGSRKDGFAVPAKKPLYGRLLARICPMIRPIVRCQLTGAHAEVGDGVFDRVHGLASPAFESGCATRQRAMTAGTGNVSQNIS